MQERKESKIKEELRKKIELYLKRDDTTSIREKRTKL